MIRNKQQLEGLDEATLRKEVIIPLLKAMGYQDVEEYHGSGELGMDIVGWKPNQTGERENTGVVVKTVKMTGRAALAPGTVGEIQTQILQCLGGQFPDPRNGEQRNIHKCLVISARSSRREFMAALSPVLNATNLLDRVEFWNADALWERYKKYVLGVTGKIDELMSLGENLDADYRLEFGELSPTKREIKIVPKGDAEHEPKPLIDMWEFADTEEGEAAKKAIDELIRRGTPVELPLSAFRNIPLPAFIREEATLAGVNALQLEPTFDDNALDYLAIVEFQCEDGGVFTIEGVHFREVRRGTDERVLSNVDQLRVLPLDITLTIRRDQPSVNLHFSIKYPQNPYVLQKMVELQQCLSTTFAMNIYEATTGLRTLYVPTIEPMVDSPHPEYVSLIHDLAAIQQKAKRSIILPDREWTEDEERTIAKLRMIIQNGGFLSRWSDATVTVPNEPEARAELSSLLDTLVDGTSPMGKEEEDVVELFGTTIPLGKVFSSFHMRVENLAEVRSLLADPPTDLELIRVRLVPGAGDEVAVHYKDWSPELRVKKPEWMEDPG